MLCIILFIIKKTNDRCNMNPVEFSLPKPNFDSPSPPRKKRCPLTEIQPSPPSLSPLSLQDRVSKDPKPEFSFISPAISAGRRAPEAPRKGKGRKSIFGNSDAPTGNVFSKSAEMIRSGMIPKSSGQIVRLFANGDFSDVYNVTGENALVKGHSNDQIVVKSYREQCGIKPLMQYAKNAYDQYLRIETHLNVTCILNNPLKNGYFVVEKAVSNVDYSMWFNNLSFDDQTKEAKQLLSEIKNFLDYAVIHKEPLDIKSNNLMMDSEGKVCLIDFVEQIQRVDQVDRIVLIDSDGEMIDSIYWADVAKAVKEFSQGNRFILEFLTLGFESTVNGQEVLEYIYDR